MYDKIIKDFKCRPRDVHTVPIRSKLYKWFHVFVENGILYVESAHYNTPKSSVKKRALLREECNNILEIYHRRMAGEQISHEAQACTHSQVYWYGIFSDLSL